MMCGMEPSGDLCNGRNLIDLERLSLETSQIAPNGGELAQMPQGTETEQPLGPAAWSFDDLRSGTKSPEGEETPG